MPRPGLPSPKATTAYRPAYEENWTGVVQQVPWEGRDVTILTAVTPLPRQVVLPPPLEAPRGDIRLQSRAPWVDVIHTVAPSSGPMLADPVSHPRWVRLRERPQVTTGRPR